jgi:hypothetical protein
MAGYGLRAQAAPRTRSALDDVVLFETFESTAPGQLPVGWTEVDRDSGYCSWFDRRSTWEVYSRPEFPAHSGTRFAMCHYNDQQLPNDDWLVLPVITATGEITLDYWAAAQDAGYPESFEVRASTGGTQPEDFTTVLATETGISSEWTHFTQDLSGLSGSSFRIAFHYVSVDRFALKLDDVQIAASGLVSGAIAGTVVDDSARVISYAAVQINSLGRSVRTDSMGAFLLAGLPPASYTVRVSHEFFNGRVIPGVTVAATDTTRLQPVLTPLALGMRHYATTYSPRPITDFDTTVMRLDMRDTVVIWDLDVTVNLTHSSVGDLDIWLRGPDSTRVLLAAHDSLIVGQNMTYCQFDDQADLPFTAGQAPYTGHFRPVEPLSRFNGDSLIRRRGADVHGREWFLYVHDAAAIDEGSLIGVSMDVVWQLPQSAPDHPVALPQTFSFAGNYPNPFNSETHFKFSLAAPGRVDLTLYNLLGQQTAKVIDRVLQAGSYDVAYDASGLASGVYLARLSAQGASQTRKVLLIR